MRLNYKPNIFHGDLEETPQTVLTDENHILSGRQISF
jgi:hypothetical protein